MGYGRYWARVANGRPLPWRPRPGQRLGPTRTSTNTSWNTNTPPSSIDDLRDPGVPRDIGVRSTALWIYGAVDKGAEGGACTDHDLVKRKCVRRIVVVWRFAGWFLFEYPVGFGIRVVIDGVIWDVCWIYMVYMWFKKD